MTNVARFYATFNSMNAGSRAGEFIETDSAIE